jgi:FkbM family methyltransferase
MAMNSASLRLDVFTKALRLLPVAMPGKTRLAKRLLGSSLRTGDLWLSSRDGFLFAVPSLREPVGFYLLIDGVYEREAVDFVLKSLRLGATFLDVGANIGVFTLPAARKVGATGRVIAIEPSPFVFPYLERNVAANDLSNVGLLRCAAFNRDDDRIPFYEAPADHFGMGSLGQQFSSTAVEVPTCTLDHIMVEQQIQRVDFIKIDVEGFEAKVFEGATKLLTGDQPPPVLFEFCDWAEARVPDGEVGAAQKVLLDHGYRIWRLGDMLVGKPPLTHILKVGFETLFATKNC